MGKEISRENIYSYSKLSTFNTCKYAYYLNYILKKKSEDNIYSFLGSGIHRICELLQQGKISNDDAKAEFLECVQDAEMFDYNFMSESVRNSYIDCINLYFENYEPITDIKEFKIEEYVLFKIGEIYIQGYIDLYTISDDGYIDLYDYKSSSKFSKKELEKKQIQLILYAIALEEKYPQYKIRNLYFDMCKYTKNKRGTLKKRTEHDEQVKALVKIKYDSINKESAINYVVDTYNEIKKMNKNISFDWKCNKSKENKFFCQNLCGYYNECQSRL